MSESGVTYTVKELIAMLERTLTDQLNSLGADIKVINSKLDDKASAGRVTALEDRVIRLELAAAADAGSSKTKVWMGNAAVLVASSAIGAFLYYVVSGVHG